MEFSARAFAQSLRLAHQTLADSLDSVQPFVRVYPQAKTRLREFYRRLLVFFSKEDEVFFQALYQRYKDDRAATSMIDFLSHDLKDLKVQFLMFSEKYSGEVQGQNTHMFPKDFTDFCALVMARIKIEEERLLPLLEKMESV